MELKKFPIWALVLTVCGLLFTACDKDDPDEPKPEPLNVAKNIVGNWLLASSTADEWATYEFTESSRINATTFENKKLQTGSGFYWIDEDKASVTGNFDYGDGQLPIYIDWVVEKVQTFELTLKLYDNNQYLGNTALYRILSTCTIEANATTEINFKAICGTDNVSDFNVLDTAIATVSTSGELTGLKVGETYLTFKTQGGIAALKIEVSPAPKTFAEQVVGTWIYDKPSEKEWQATTFVADGFVDVKWANPYSYNTIETANGYYSLSDENCIWSVTTSYNMTINQKWQTEEINDFIWTYQCFSDNQSVGKYTGHRLLGTITLKPGEKSTPEYTNLTFGYDIVGYASNSKSIATVDAESGEITAVDYGRTYINVNTAKGAGYFEVNVEKPVIPYDFPKCVGVNVSKVKEILGSKPDYSTSTMIAYFNPTSTIDMIGVSFDETTGLSKGVTITYNSTVNTSAVTVELDKTYIPFTSQTTDTYKAYMDTDKRDTATLGVTWDIPNLTLTYVNLAK